MPSNMVVFLFAYQNPQNPKRNKLGGHFGPEKKYLAPPPSPQTFPLGALPPLAHPPRNPPPPFPIFLIKNRPPGHLLASSLSPRPGTEQNKKYPKCPPSKVTEK